MSGLGDWLARGVTYVGVLDGGLFDGEEGMTIGEEGQTQVICDSLVPVPPTVEFDDRVRRTVAEQHDEISALKAENAELRELMVRVNRARRYLCDAYPDAADLDCEECPAWDACRDDLGDRMRELGIEVGA